MKRIYSFYDKEALKPRKITFEFPPPFEKNLEEDLKSTYGEDLVFVKLIDHESRVIKLYSGYDSGKGTTIIPPVPRKRPRKRIDTWLKEVSQWSFSILEVKYSVGPNLIVMSYKDKLFVYRDAWYDSDRKSVSGYTLGRYPSSKLSSIIRNQDRPVEDIKILEP